MLLNGFDADPLLRPVLHSLSYELGSEPFLDLPRRSTITVPHNKPPAKSDSRTSSISTMAPATANTYEYTRLNGPQDIRLITLRPGAGEEPLVLNIQHTSLNQRPSYKALSYVWVPQNSSHLVQCNDASLAVGGNLRDALRCLRKLDAPRLLWIDRIAIDQNNDGERAQQVGLIGDIYSSASLVVVWLGTADDSTEAAIGLLNDLGGQMLEYRKVHNLNSHEKAQTAKNIFQYPSLDAPAWPAVRSLLQRPWFSRVWTFQEIVLAQEAVLYCGAHTVR
jgi:hypothetical protein